MDNLNRIQFRVAVTPWLRGYELRLGEMVAGTDRWAIAQPLTMKVEEAGIEVPPFITLPPTPPRTSWMNCGRRACAPPVTTAAKATWARCASTCRTCAGWSSTRKSHERRDQ